MAWPIAAPANNITAKVVRPRGPVMTTIPHEAADFVKSGVT
jgi:hypothetical protein